MIEVEVHQQLRALLRQQTDSHWTHHLTMARLVARALRLGRSALIQTGTESGVNAPYRLSYLMPLLVWDAPAIVVASESVQQWLLNVELPRLQQWLDVSKPVQIITRNSRPTEFSGLSFVTPQLWLHDRLKSQKLFPTGILTLIDGVDDLDTWAQEVLNLKITGQHWDQLMLAQPAFRETIRDLRIHLTHSLFQHPANPYNCHVLEDDDRLPIYETLYQLQQNSPLAEPWAELLTHLTPQPIASNRANSREALTTDRHDPGLLSAQVDRQSGTFTLQHGPIRLAPVLRPIWQLQPTVLIGSALDLDANADTYRQTHGLDDLTCIKFSPPRHESSVQLYQPDRMPMPNTPQFQPALLSELRQILSRSHIAEGLAVILVGDTPLRTQVGTTLAAEWGSRVQVDRIPQATNGILVTGWDEWSQFQQSGTVSAPRCIVIATLPMPSLENPLVAARVKDYKQLRQDWFRLYLLPTALMALQRAVFPVRSARGLVALLDSRVIHRIYGTQVLAALSPYARINYLDDRWNENWNDSGDER